MTHANFGQRFLAYIIDNIILGVICVILSMLLGAVLGIGGFFGADGNPPNNSAAVNALAGLGTLVYALVLWGLQFLYFGYFFSKNGQTLGKRALGIKVVGRDGQTPSFLMGGLRGTFGYWLSGLVFGLGYLWALFDSNGETWHDKVFGTHVDEAAGQAV